MNLSKPTTSANLEAAFAGESMANRKYLFFADVAKTLGNNALAKLFRDTAAQETEHAFTHFRLLHPELMIDDPAALNDADKQKMLTRCPELAIEGETYEFTTMYPSSQLKPVLIVTATQKQNSTNKSTKLSNTRAFFVVPLATSAF